MIPSCFSSTKSLTHNSQMPQSLITSIYQTQLCNTPTYLTLTWSKTLLSHTLTIQATDSFSLTISLYPSTFSFLRNRPGSKSVILSHHHYRIKLYWDFTHAKFERNSAEPKSCFYLAISYNACIEFFLGDLDDTALRRSGTARIGPFSEPTLLSRREHVFGHRNYLTRAQFLGSHHEIGIECAGGILRVKVDGEVGLVVKRLVWKFRGNEKIMVGDSAIEFYWDVFDWVAGGGAGHGVFVFQVGDGGVWPEMIGMEKKLMRKSSSFSPSMSSPTPSCSSVLQWAEAGSDGGRSSCASSTRSSGSGGFSLLLFAWRSS
ncbi:Sulfate/thiosulfate import ATP-binding protein cysA [Thalictrum thalictroides]|uniref:Sulfate/thiosulfate import ATP-binding protein cysA n=1 Tax=Thalictrum thalictroides TaxID=46969 RepID=A0A7J6WGT8_THATH|nr:Sulfate/thiosulfate import ATP-binding protein cysA [Thalictrum thalictroides]